MIFLLAFLYRNLRKDNYQVSNNKILKGTAVLGIAGVIVKVLGALFKVPLTALIGTEGLAYYGYAYPLYSLFLVIATAGIPVAISRLVSERVEGHAYGTPASFLYGNAGQRKLCP